MIVSVVPMLYKLWQMRIYLILQARGGKKMNGLIDLTASKIHTMVQQQGSITLAKLEYAIDASYNLIFLAVERLVATGKLNLKKDEWDYTVSIFQEPE